MIMSPSEKQILVTFVMLCMGVPVSGFAFAGPDQFDGTWSVQLVASAGLCGRIGHQTLTIQDGRVSAAAAAVSVSGQVNSGGSVSLVLQRGPAQGTAAGRLSGAAGSGTWVVAALGCSGRWTAQWRTLSAQAF